MKMKLKNTDTIVDVIPKSKNNKLSYLDIKTNKFYNWDDLEPIRMKAVSTKTEIESNNNIKIGVTPIIKMHLNSIVNPS